MKHRLLALIIALLTGAIVTLLLIPADLSNKQLWIVFLITITITFLITWIFNEFLVFRDLLKMELYVKRYKTRRNEKKIILKMKESKQVVEGMTGLLEDQKEEIEDLIKKSDLRKQFIADISHELKSPLFSAQGYVHTLLDNVVEEKEIQKKFLKKAARNLGYIDNLIQDLLMLSQIESKSIQMIRDHFELMALVREVVDEYQSRADKNGIKLSVESDKESVIVFADYTRIVMVLTNLINNGIKYNIEGGMVTIRVEDLEEGIKVSVIDTGEGIDKKHHHKVFNRFFRVDKSRTVKKSTGLGLAIVKHILENHGTSIQLDSDIGKGSTFSFILARDKVSTRESKDQI
ncbi:MAG: HAMP domain-containing sensor histidine kinase [Bacteroidota bacterium]